MSLKNNNLILVLLLIAGCKQMPQVTVPTLPGLTTHKIDIQQGNVITQEMLDKLQPGMTRTQVRFVLGTPLLVDVFRTDRWDYFYSMKKRGELLEQRQLKVFFDGDKMVRYEGDIVTDTKPGAETVAGTKPAAKPAIKPEINPDPVAAMAAPQPVVPTVPIAPTREPVAEVGKPQLQLVPAPGEPAKPEELKPEPVAPTAAVPTEKDALVAPPLDAPPMPRLVIKPEPTEPSSPFAATPALPTKPDAAAVVARPEVKPAEKVPAQAGFFGRMFGSSPSQPAPSAAAPALAPVPVPAPAPVAVAVPKPVAPPVVAKPEVKTAEKPATTATGRGFFGRLLDAAAKPAPRTNFGEERTAEPGSPPPPFYDPEPAPK